MSKHHVCNHHKCDKCTHHKKQYCYCDKKFRIRLGGLTSGLAFRLNQLTGCDIKLVIEGETMPIEGKLKLVGTDFAEILLQDNEEQENPCNQFLIVPFESIKFIES